MVEDAEVRVGETVSVHGMMVTRSDKLMHNKYRMVNETQGCLAAASEVLVGRADLSARKLAAFPENEATVIDAKLAEYAALDFDPDASGLIGVSR